MQRKQAENTYFLAGLIAPIQIITTFGLLQLLHLNGTYAGVILVFAAIQMSWGVFMFTGFIGTVPRELDEAAFIDGYPPLKVFFSIIFPLLKPIVVTTVVMLAIFIWNDFQIPLYFFNTAKCWTLPLTVYNFFGRYFNYWNYVFANLGAQRPRVLALTGAFHGRTMGSLALTHKAAYREPFEPLPGASTRMSNSPEE